MKKQAVGMIAATLFAAASVWAEGASKGIEQYESRKYTDAERSLRAAMNDEPEDWRGPYYLGMTLLKLQKPSEARTALESAEGKPDAKAADVKVGLAQAYVIEKNLDKANSLLEEAASLDESAKEINYTRGMLLLARKDYNNAAKQFEAALSQDARNAYAHYYAGMAYNGMKRPDRMVEHFEAFLKLAPDAPESSKVQSVLRSVR